VGLRAGVGFWGREKSLALAPCVDVIVNHRSNYRNKHKVVVFTLWLCELKLPIRGDILLHET
jgi:hypothetical protein